MQAARRDGALVGRKTATALRESRLVQAAVLVSGIGVVATAVAEGPRIALFLAALSVLAPLVCILVVPRDARGFMLRLAAAAVAARWIVAAAIQAGLALADRPRLFGDELSYDIVSSMIARLGDGELIPIEWRYLDHAYTDGTAVAYSIAGHDPVVGIGVNAALGVVTAAVVYRLAALVWRPRGDEADAAPETTTAARLAAGLAAFYPTLLLWSGVFLKDVSVMLAVTLVVYAWVGIVRGRVSWPAVVIAVPALWYVLETRWPLVPVLAGAALLGALAALATTGRRGLLATAAVVLVGAAAVFAAPTARAWFEDIPDESKYQRIVSAQAARTAIEDAPPTPVCPHCEEDPEVPGAGWTELAGYAPKGLSAVLLGPYPWQARNADQAVGALLSPFALVLYALAALGTLRLWRRDRVAACVLLAMVLSYWAYLVLVEGNVGTAFRHRDTVVPILLVFAAGGVLSLRESRAAAHGEADRPGLRTLEPRSR
jgi:hypothetical protein